MQEKQFVRMMDKLEEIRCGIIDVETSNNRTDKIDLTKFREKFFDSLERKTGWGRNEIKALFDDVASFKSV